MTTKRTHVSAGHENWILADRQTKMTRQDSPQPFHDGCLPHEVASDPLPFRIIHAHGGYLLQHHDLSLISVLQRGSVIQVAMSVGQNERALTSVFTSHHACGNQRQ